MCSRTTVYNEVQHKLILNTGHYNVLVQADTGHKTVRVQADTGHKTVRVQDYTEKILYKYIVQDGTGKNTLLVQDGTGKNTLLVQDDRMHYSIYM